MAELTDDEKQAKIDELNDMFGPEDLHPDLVPYLSDGRIGRVLSHPLTVHVMYHEQSNKLINRAYVHKKQAVEKAREAADWERFVFLHERPYRIDALETVLFEEEISEPDRIWPLIAGVWIDSENIWQCLNQWVDIWNSEGHAHSVFMEDDEMETFKALPDTITVWRGVAHRESVEGMSWTVDKAKAEWFARRFAGGEGRTPLLVEGTVSKRDVLAYFSNRGESEIVAFPEDVHVENVFNV